MSKTNVIALKAHLALNVRNVERSLEFYLANGDKYWDRP